MNFGDGVPSGPVPAKFPAHVMSDADLKATYGKSMSRTPKALLSASGFDTIEGVRPQVHHAGRPLRAVRPDRAVAAETEPRHQHQAHRRGFRQVALAVAVRHRTTTRSSRSPTWTTTTRAATCFWYLKDQSGRQNSARFFNDELDGLVLKQKTILDDKAARPGGHRYPEEGVGGERTRPSRCSPRSAARRRGDT